MQTSHYTAYDGLLRSPIIRTHLSAWFGPEQVLSPTSLERYVECPFRFFLQHILALEPLEEPGEQIEHTRRGSAVHRAMSRLHAQHHDPADDVIEAALLEELARAVAEYADRAPGPVARRLWQLEGQRLRRLAGPYVEQWRTFAQKWGQVIGTPRPWMLEADFGFDDPRSFAALEIERGGIQVRIAGRIDRIDRAETTDGVRFWVIDYKTGKASRYTADGLATMTQLQLALYTLAVERLFLAEERGRPGALAYWMPGDGGPKIVFPKLRSSGTPQALPTDLWEAYREQLEEKVAAVVGHIRAGDFPLQPSQRDCTATCPYNQVCRITQGRAAEKSFPLPLPLTRDSGERGT
jgi:ATP-dependent helicase/DNAse subunit B